MCLSSLPINSRLPRLDEQSRHLQDVLQLMGLWPEEGPPALLAQLRELALKRLKLTEADVQDLISQRAQVRACRGEVMNLCALLQHSPQNQYWNSRGRLCLGAGIQACLPGNTLSKQHDSSVFSAS